MATTMVWSFAMAIAALTAFGRACICLERRPSSLECKEPHEGRPQAQKDTGVQLEVLQFEPSGKFHFLKLPPEIRNMIYRLSLVDIGPERLPQRRFWLPSFRQPALTQVSRQIRRDTLPMFFESNLFMLRVPSPSHSLDLHHAREEQRWMKFVRGLKLFAACGYLSMVSRMAIVYSDQGSEGSQCFGLFRRCKRTEIIVECFRCELQPPDFEELARKGSTSEAELRDIWQLRMGTRVGNDDTDWNDCDAVDESLATAVGELANELRRQAYFSDAEY
ncbi:hypothetical protein VMCG_09962 [Cytospora schulzeri]|uniref:F-box domain-containing protein n=1 Tax=Cytospora schulzeri TaxID=448051 RepID=A0A423VIU3_9PEZI|nr:hypothetical protein VMCG_09962 [Valsa malicola]